MKVVRKKIDDGQVRLEVVATPQEVNRALQNAHQAFAQQMGIQPDPTKTAAQAVEEKMGIKDLDSVVEASAKKSLVPMALDEKGILPAWPPEPDDKTPFKRNQEYRFVLDVTTKPEYELSSYDPVDLVIPPFSIPEDALDERIQQFAANFTAFVKDEEAEDRPVESGDIVRLALKVEDNGEVMKGLTTDGRTYAVGEGYMPEGFDEAIKGMKVGETKQFQFEGQGFDDQGQEHMKTYDAEVTVLEMQKKEVPEITDEWVAKTLPMYDSAAAMREDFATNLEKEVRQQYDSYVRQTATTQLASRFEGKIPDKMYEAMRDNMIQNLRAQLAAQGKTWEQYVMEAGGEETVMMMLLVQVRELLVQGFALDALFRHEKMKLTEADIDAACIEMNSQVPPEETRKRFAENHQMTYLSEAAERLKAGKWLVEHANITVEESKAEGEEPEPAPADE